MKRAVSLLFICLSLCCMQSHAAEPGASAQIKCDDITDNGIGSSYTSHTFSLLDDLDNISACQWNFYIKKSDQSFLKIKSESCRSFTIDPVASDNDYFINAQGEYEGRVECEYTQDGKQYTASPFHVSLELKPIIISIDDLQIIKEGYNFRVRFTVTYAGSDHLQICLEEETNLVSRYTTVAEPDVAHILTDKLTTFEYTWVTVIVENQYGKAEHVMEFEPTVVMSSDKIQCDDEILQETGIGSAYIPHTFRFSGADGDADSFQWSFSLKDKSGDYVQVSSGDQSEFIINKIDDADRFYINDDGELEGQIGCIVICNGKTYVCNPFQLSLELKPIIESINDLQKIRSGNEFYLTFSVKYSGAESIRVALEEDYSPQVRVYDFHEPDVAHVVTKTLTLFEYTWVTIIAENQYGKAEHVMEFAPDYQGGINLPERSDGVAGINEISVKDKRIHFESELPMNVAIYSLDGKCVYQAAGLQHADIDLSHLAPQLLIINISDINSSNTDKIFLR